MLNLQLRTSVFFNVFIGIEPSAALRMLAEPHTVTHGFVLLQRDINVISYTFLCTRKIPIGQILLITLLLPVGTVFFNDFSRYFFRFLLATGGTLAVAHGTLGSAEPRLKTTAANQRIPGNYLPLPRGVFTLKTFLSPNTVPQWMC